MLRRRHSVVATTAMCATAGLVAVVAIAGCQDALTIGVHNACSTTLAVDVEESPWDGGVEPDRRPLEPGERRSLRTVTEDAATIYVAVDDDILVLDRDDLAAAPDDVDYDLEVAVADSLCP